MASLVQRRVSPFLLTLLVGLGVVVLALTLAGLNGSSPFSQLLKAYQPRRLSMMDEPGVIRLHLVSDVAIALAYYSIPLALVHFVRNRVGLTHKWIYLAFALFILACGTTHVMNVVANWYAPYRLDGLLKLFTAIVSVMTAAMLWPLLPKILSLPSPGSLRIANAELAHEVEVRRVAEDSLRAMQIDLEKRVDARTTELRDANARLQSEMTARSTVEKERESFLAREREARSEAERANRMKDEFLATLSHELRTPLGAITSWVHLLQTGTGEAEEMKEGLAVIERNARIQASLIDDLLDMSRIISGKMRLVMQPVILSDVIVAAIDTVKPMAASKGVGLSSSVDALAPPVLGDVSRLQQVVWNLLANAIKFTPKGGRVNILLARVDSHLEITVVDTGMGIAPAFLPSVFERFRQADASTTRRHGGLGLGLAIVRHLVELHGGTVEARSAGSGAGATFVVKMPIAVLYEERPLAAVNAAAAGPVQSLPRLDHLSVLVVDDESDSRSVLQRVLELRGARVFTAASVREGMTLLREKRPDVLVSDIGMPGEDGYTFITRVRALRPEEGGLVPAMALTAFARAEDRSRAIAAGFQLHLSKPVEPSELVLSLDRLHQMKVRSAEQGEESAPVVI